MLVPLSSPGLGLPPLAPIPGGSPQAVSTAYGAAKPSTAHRPPSQGSRAGAPLVVCNQAHRFPVAQQLAELGTTPRGIVLEPVAGIRRR